MTGDPHKRAISFSPEMATAIWRGRKTQTRREPGASRVVLDGVDGGGAPRRPPADLFTHGAWHRAQLVANGSLSIPWGDGRRQPAAVIRPAWRPGMRLHVRESVAALPGPRFFYRGTDELPAGARWQAPRFMPLAACRMVLVVEDARFERLQDITEADAAAEGCRTRAGFAQVWNRLHGPEAWEANPWIVVLRFRRLGSAVAMRREDHMAGMPADAGER